IALSIVTVHRHFRMGRWLETGDRCPHARLGGALTMAAESLPCGSLDEAARQRFESAWRAGQAEPIEHFLPPPEHPHYLPTLEELVHIELEFAWKAWPGSADPRPPLVEAYLTRFPRLQDPAIVLHLLEQEFLVRQQHGDHPTNDEYLARFPDV